MKALRLLDRRRLAVEEIPAPEQPGPDEVQLRNRFCGICGTDLHKFEAPSLEFGHDYRGRSDAVGASDQSSRARGDAGHDHPPLMAVNAGLDMATTPSHPGPPGLAGPPRAPRRATGSPPCA